MMNVFVYGSCVSRGIFDYAQCGGYEKQFNVIEYIAKNSVFSLWGNQIELVFNENANSREMDWNTRMVYYDSKKLVPDRIKKSEADIFVMDFVDERLRRIKINGQPEKVITYSESFLRGGYIEQLSKYEWIEYDACNYYESYRVISKICEFIKEFYQDEQIFIIEAYPVLTYYNKKHEMCLFNEKNIQSTLRLTKQLEMYYEIAKKCMPNANYIKFPRNVCGVEDHKWGLSNVHFEYGCYDYFLREMIKKIPSKAYN